MTDISTDSSPASSTPDQANTPVSAPDSAPLPAAETTSPNEPAATATAPSEPSTSASDADTASVEAAPADLHPALIEIKKAAENEGHGFLRHALAELKKLFTHAALDIKAEIEKL